MGKIKALLVIALVMVSLSSIYVISVLTGVDGMFVMQDVKKVNPITFDYGSQTSLDHLKRFYEFSTEEESFKKFLEKNNENLKVQNNRVEFINEVSLAGLYRNHCKRIYCFQSKTPFKNIPSNLWKALIGTEDIRFLEHKGVDLKSILRALWVDLKEMKYVQGGSTITQQLVKNLFLTNEKSIRRKLNEVIIAIYVEFTYTKEEILQAYLNEQMWGSLNGIRIMGHQAASLFYFNKPSSRLNEIEATALISMLKGPYYYSPIKHLDRLINRTKAQFDKLVDKDLYYSDKKDFWTKDKWVSWQESLERRMESMIYRDIYLTSVKKGKNRVFETYTWYRGISSVRKTLESRIGKKDFAFKLYRKKINCPDCEKFQVYSKFEKKLSKAIESERHQIGSIFKPIIYQNFLNEGYKRDRKISTEPITLNLKSGKWTPNDSKTAEKELTLEVALQKSKNRPFIRLCSEYGFEHIETYLKILSIPNLKTPLGEYPAQLLGALELSVGEVAKVYSGFVSGLCDRVTSKATEWENTVFDILSDPKKTTISNIVKNDLSRIKFFGKTGTTNNGNDTWFVSFDGSFLTVIWGGVETHKGEAKTLISGASSAFRLYQFFVRNSAKRPGDLSCMDPSVEP